MAPLGLALLHVGLLTAAVPVSAAARLDLPLPAAAPMVYLAQQTGDDGYGTVPHLRPRPEGGVAAPKPAPTSGTTSGSGGAGAAGARTQAGAAPSAPRDARDSPR
jgi:hypothetical protein